MRTAQATATAALALLLLGTAAPPAAAEGSILASAWCSDISATGKARGPLTYADATMRSTVTDSGSEHAASHFYSWATGTGGGVAKAVTSLGLRSFAARCEHGGASGGDRLPEVGCMAAEGEDPSSLRWEGQVGLTDGRWAWSGTETTGATSRAVHAVADDDGRILVAPGRMQDGAAPRFQSSAPALASLFSTPESKECSVRYGSL